MSRGSTGATYGKELGDDGTLRADLTTDELGSLLGSLLQAAARMTAEHQAGVEKAAALATSVFLHGTLNPAGPAPRHGQDSTQSPSP